MAHTVHNRSISGGIEGQIERGEKEEHFSVPDFDDRRLPVPVLAQLPNGSFPVTVPGNAVFSFFPFPNNPRGPFGPNTFTQQLPIDGNGARWFARFEQGTFQGANLGFHAGARYSHSIESVALPSSGGAIDSMLNSRVQNIDIVYYLGVESLSWVHGLRFNIGFTSADLAPRLPAVNLPNVPLLLDVTPINGGIVSQDEEYVSATSAPGVALLSGLGYAGTVTAQGVLGPFGQLMVAGFSPVGVDPFFFPQHRSNFTGQTSYSGSIARDRRVYLFGGQWDGRRIATDNNPNKNPQITFSGLPSVFPVGTSLLDGAPAALAAAAQPTGVYQTFSDFRQRYPYEDGRGIIYFQGSFYFQHQRSITPSLRLTAGLRLEFRTFSSFFVQDLASNFNRPQLLADATAAEAGCSSPCPGFAPAIAQAFPANYASLSISPATAGPMFGIAWSPFGYQDWIVRAGYGLYPGTVPGFAANDVRQGFNQFIPLNLANSPLFTNQGEFLLNLANPLVRQLRPDLDIVPNTAVNFSEISVNPLELLTQTLTNLSSFGTPPTFGVLALSRAQQHLSNPYSEHYVLAIERQLRKAAVSVAYVGTRGINFIRPETPQGGTLRSSMTVSQIGTVAGGFPAIVATSRPAQQVLAGGIVGIAQTVYSSSSSSTYNSFQAELRGQIGRSVQVDSSYTYLHAIDDASDFFDLAGSFALPQSTTRSGERASASFDVRHRLAGTFVWDVPHWKNSAWLTGWQLSGLWAVQSGQPYTVNSTFDINRDGNLTDRLNTTQGLEFGPFPNDPTALLRVSPSVTLRNLLAPAGDDGAIGRNTFRSWPFANVDSALTKEFPLRNSRLKRLVFRVETFNVFNHTEFAIPERLLEAPAFGKSFQTTLPARTFQIAGKAYF